MPQVILTDTALYGLKRCQYFLAKKNTHAASRAVSMIKHHFSLLIKDPKIGRPHPEKADLRELIIPFGGSGYIALYHHHLLADQISVVAFRHQKETGYAPLP